MVARDDFRWFKETFHQPLEAAAAGTPFSIDLLAAIAAQETGEIWARLRGKLPVAKIVEICVGDIIDGNGTKGRRAFPKMKAELMAAPRGQEMFDIAHDALVQMAAHVPAFARFATMSHKFCRGYGIFQYDLQFFKVDPDYFLQRRWHDFSASLGKCIGELHAAARRAKLANHSTLTDLQQVHVAIAYNAGSFKPERGLQQGHFDGRFYGEKVFDFLRLSRSVASPTAPATIVSTGEGRAPLAPSAPVAAEGESFEVNVETAPLRLRSEPKIVAAKPSSNVIAHLPDGHRVRKIAGKKGDKFFEVETSLNGAHLRGFAASQFLVPVEDDIEISVVVPTATEPASGVVAVHAPRKSGSITKRTAAAGALSLNEANQPGRVGVTPEELRGELAAIIDHLAVDKASHIRYQPRDGATFCNIYVHDFCHLAGVYLPRVWWTADAIERLTRGQPVEPRLGSTIDEQRANDLFRWLRAFGPRFGWRQAGSLTELQTEANIGAVGMIVARRKIEGKSGHIVIVPPETDEQRAKRDSDGTVTAPLQSQAGVRNFRYGTSSPNWWNGEQFADSAFWLHA
jgi:hypothetical protein